MPHITILGSYNRESVGDKAILVGLLHVLLEGRDDLRVRVLATDVDAIAAELEEYFPDGRTEVSPLVEAREGSPVRAPNVSRKPSIRRHVVARAPRLIRSWASILRYLASPPSKASQDSDALLVGGGNLLMDLYPSWPFRPYRVAHSFRRQGKPVGIVGVGAFPIRTRMGKLLLRRLCSGAGVVYVRDSSTETFLREKWKVDARLQPDFALSIPSGEVPNGGDRTKVCVNVGPVMDRRSRRSARAQREMVMRLGRQLAKYYRVHQGEIRFTILDTNYPTDRIGARLLQAELVRHGVPADMVEYPDRLMSCREILQEFAGARAAVTCRLHAAILALRVGTPVLAVAYQPKVRSVMADWGLLQSVIGLDDLDGLYDRMMRVDEAPEDYHLGNMLSKLDAQNAAVAERVMDYFFG